MIIFRSQNKIFQNLKSYAKQVSSALTDFNIGSILNSLFYAFSNALADLYASLQNVYDASFVAKATGPDLDSRVADFTLQRRYATRSSGTATFYRNQPASTDIIIPAGTRIKTITTNLLQGVEFQTTIEKVIQISIKNEAHIYYITDSQYDLDSRKVYDITLVTGTVSNLDGYTFVKDVDYELITLDATQAKINWIESGVSPDENTTFYVTYQPLSIDAPIQATGAGKFGNAAIGTIVNMVSKPSGVDEVINYEQTSGGTDQETDTQLRERVPLYLSSLSKSVKNSLEAAALSVNGVQNATVYEPDPPNGYVTIFIDDGSGGATTDIIRSVKDAIDGTLNGVGSTSVAGARAAGIAVNVTTPTLKDITIFVTIYIQVGFDSTTVSSDAETSVYQWLTNHATGEDVIRAELINTIMQVDGVENITLDTMSINGTTSGDTVVGENEVARLKTITIQTR
jgi:uncharacterized phage protein gp47/JayE